MNPSGLLITVVTMEITQIVCGVAPLIEPESLQKKEVEAEEMFIVAPFLPSILS